MPYEIKIGFLGVVALLMTAYVWLFDQGLVSPSAEQLGSIFIGGWFLLWLWWISATATDRDWLHHGIQFITSLLIFGIVISPVVDDRSIALPWSATLALVVTFIVSRYGSRVPR